MLTKSTLFVWLMVAAVGLVCLFFFFLNDSRIVSPLHFPYNWQNMFQASEPIIARFPSNKGGNLDIRIPRDSAMLHLVPCMCVVCRVRGLGPSCMSKQNVLSLILLILLVNLMN